MHTSHTWCAQLMCTFQEPRFLDFMEGAGRFVMSLWFVSSKLACSFVRPKAQAHQPDRLPGGLR